MIDFKSLTVDELDREGLKGTAFAVRFDERLKILDGHDDLSVNRMSGIVHYSATTRKSCQAPVRISED